MSKYLYRLWFPMVTKHGSDFNKLCEHCQEKIEETLNDGYLLPTTCSIDTSMGISLKFGFSFFTIDLCKKCQEEIRRFLDSADFISFGNPKSIEVWRNQKET